jgi:hypothetical protein
MYKCYQVAIACSRTAMMTPSHRDHRHRRHIAEIDADSQVDAALLSVIRDGHRFCGSIARTAALTALANSANAVAPYDDGPDAAPPGAQDARLEAGTSAGCTALAVGRRRAGATATIDMGVEPQKPVRHGTLFEKCCEEPGQLSKSP